MVPRLLVLALLVFAVSFAFLYLGLYDVSALKPHTGIVKWALTTGVRRSVHRHAPEIAPPPLSDPGLLALGFDHYREMCVMCHGAPGVKRSEVGQGLNPLPPRLDRAARRWSPSELYWILKNGIKMTGMPAFGETHDARELWAMVAFVKSLPRLTPEAYQEMERKARTEDEEDQAHGHAHDHSHEHGH